MEKIPHETLQHLVTIIFDQIIEEKIKAIDIKTSSTNVPVLSEQDINKIASAVVGRINDDNLRKISRELYSTNNLLLAMCNKIVKRDYSILKHGPTVDIRYLILIMLANEIKRNNIEGSLAELGVYRGAFAQRVRNLLPGRKFYLFDTFEGFDENQKANDRSVHGSKPGSFSDTSVQIALNTIGDTELCIVKKGLFPDTANDVDDTFAFVSLDADLYEPIKEGLNFFYDRLAPGGYILVHDFLNETYPGCGKAVIEFCRARHIGYSPMPDTAGSALITKVL